jgi:hypothetical protein
MVELGLGLGPRWCENEIEATANERVQFVVPHVRDRPVQTYSRRNFGPRLHPTDSSVILRRTLG